MKTWISLAIVVVLLVSSAQASLATTHSTTSDPVLKLKWSGSDPTSGSGLRGVWLYWRKDEVGNFQIYGSLYNKSPILFDSTLTGGDGFYEFYTIALDWVHNKETAPSYPDISVQIDSTVPDRPALEPLPPFVKGTAVWVTITTTTNAVEYQFEWTTKPDFSPPIVTSEWTTATTILAGGLPDGVKFFFRVKARAAGHAESTWSPVESTTPDASAPDSWIEGLEVLVSSLRWWLDNRHVAMRE